LSQASAQCIGSSGNCSGRQLSLLSVIKFNLRSSICTCDKRVALTERLDSDVELALGIMKHGTYATEIHVQRVE
ncbi:MAG: hypothetical protein VYC03_08235, partial [Pseudomonadota bacterium]|nr:hypothetical protein [Pseudomonadota bacterium]